MSILWLEPFIFDPTDSNVFTFQSLNIVIYKIDDDLEKPNIKGFVDKSTKKEMGEEEIGYYFSSSHITFVDISEKTDWSVLEQLMKLYKVV